MHYAGSSSAEYGVSSLSKSLRYFSAMDIELVIHCRFVRAENSDYVVFYVIEYGEAFSDFFLYFVCRPLRVKILFVDMETFHDYLEPWQYKNLSSKKRGACRRGCPADILGVEKSECSPRASKARYVCEK